MLFEFFEKLTRACLYIQISRETMLLLINNLHKNVRDNYSFRFVSFGVSVVVRLDLY